jgi:hypothetical protein
MPQVFCRACLTYCQAGAKQVGRLVICPACHCKFAVPRPVRTRPSPVSVGIGLLAVAAACLVIVIKAQKPTSAPKAPAGTRQVAHVVLLGDAAAT